MKHTIFLVIMLTLISGGIISPGNAGGQEKQILEMTKKSWLAFRNYNGRQLIYFTQLEAWKCGIKQVNYSINSDALDQIYQLQPCDPANPNAITTDKPYISLPLGTSQTIAVQLTYEDGTKSEIVRLLP
jgi:hypothetical protein